MTDALGNIIYQNQRVEFNEAGLKEVAKIADGQFFRATDTKSLEQIYGDIDKMEKSTVAVKKYQEYRDLFPVCLMSGVRPAGRAASIVANHLEEAAVRKRYRALMSFGAPVWFWGFARRFRFLRPVSFATGRTTRVIARSCANSLSPRLLPQLSATVNRSPPCLAIWFCLCSASPSPSLASRNRDGATLMKT